MTSRRRAVLLAALLVTGACSAAASGPDDTDGAPLDGVGVLPQGATTTIDLSTITAPPGTDTIPATDGSRVLVIGDSILASTSARHTNDMCKALVPLGWRVEVDAETSRFIDFAGEVLDKRWSAGWHAVVIGLGSNYGRKQAVYHDLLEEAVDRVSPLPIVLVTVTEFDPSRLEVNDSIRQIAAAHPNVVIADWASVSAADRSLLSGDGLHLSPKGRATLAATIAATLGPAPTQPGECLDTGFRDDSGGPVEGPGTTVRRPTATTARPSGTVRPPITTNPASTTSTGSTSPASTTPGSTSPGTTASPTTAPPTTSGPVTTITLPPATTASPTTTE